MKLYIQHLTRTVSILALTTLAYAQDRARFSPLEVTNKSKPQQLPKQDKLPVPKGDTTPLLPVLHGLVFKTKAKQISEKMVKSKGISVTADGIMDQANFKAMLAPYLGKPVSMQSLAMVRKKVILYYRKEGVPFVDVSLPPQDVTNGVIQFLVEEGKLGEVKVSGNKYFTTKYIKKNIKLRAGDRIKSDSLLADVDWVNQNPFLEVKPVFTEGSKDLTSDIILRAYDQRPWSFYLGYQDSGNNLTGKNRFQLGANWGNAFKLGHQINYQLTAAEKFGELNAHSVSYVIPLDWRHKLTFFGSYTDTSVEDSTFALDGNSWDLGVRYSIPLGRKDNYSHEYYLGLDYKDSRNALEFGFIPASATETRLLQFITGYNANYTKGDTFTSFDASFTLGLDGNSDDFNASRAGANPNYVYLRLNANHHRKLPKGFHYSASITAQVSSARLLSSEQISAGGYATVRGYDEREFNFTDSGIVLRNELHFPAFNLIDTKIYKDKWKFLVFADYALVSAHGDQVSRANGTTSDSATMLSVGPGLRYSVNENFSLRLDYGFQLIDAGSNQSNGRIHIGTTYRF